MKKAGVLLIFLLPLFATKCFKKEDINALINLQNDSGKDLYCIPSYVFPDTSLNFIDKDAILANESSYLVKSGVIKKIGQLPLCSSESWNHYLSNGKLIVFYFEKSVIQNNTWSAIKQNSMYYKRVIYHFTDLKECRILIK